MVHAAGDYVAAQKTGIINVFVREKINDNSSKFKGCENDSDRLQQSKISLPIITQK